MVRGRQPVAGDMVLLRNPSIFSHPTMPIIDPLTGGTIISPSGMVARIVDVDWWSRARVDVDLGGGRILRTNRNAIAGWVDAAG